MEATLDEGAPQLHQDPAEMVETCQQMVARKRALLRPWEDEDDAVQESCLEALKAAPTYQPSKCRPATFTWTVASRRMIDRWRRAKNHPRLQNIAQDCECGANFSDELMQVVDRALDAAQVLLGGKIGQGRTFPLYKLCAAIIVRAFTRQSHRSFQMMLAGSPALRERLGLPRTPGRRTFYYAERAIRRVVRGMRHAATT